MAYNKGQYILSIAQSRISISISTIVHKNNTSYTRTLCMIGPPVMNIGISILIYFRYVYLLSLQLLLITFYSAKLVFVDSFIE